MDKEKVMAARSFLLINTIPGKSNDVVTAIKDIGGERVKWAGTVTGLYDVIAVIEGETLTEIGDLITGKIDSIAGIFNIGTCLVI